MADKKGVPQTRAEIDELCKALRNPAGQFGKSQILCERAALLIEALAPRYEPGDIVVLKSGGPDMRITKLSHVVMAKCTWDDNIKDFDIRTLVRNKE